MKYIVIDSTRAVAIPAEHGHLLGAIKFVEKDYKSGEGYIFTWEDKYRADIYLVSSGEVRQPKGEEKETLIEAPRPSAPLAPKAEVDEEPF